MQWPRVGSCFDGKVMWIPDQMIGSISHMLLKTYPHLTKFTYLHLNCFRRKTNIKKHKICMKYHLVHWLLMATCNFSSYIYLQNNSNEADNIMLRTYCNLYMDQWQFALMLEFVNVVVNTQYKIQHWQLWNIDCRNTDVICV